jgi:LacI family transcriptional regulator
LFATVYLAVNGLKHINYLKLKVPEDMGVISFDEAEAFECVQLLNYYAKQPLEEFGRMAVSTLIDIMADRNS